MRYNRALLGGICLLNEGKGLPCALQYQDLSLKTEKLKAVCVIIVCGCGSKMRDHVTQMCECALLKNDRHL